MIKIIFSIILAVHGLIHLMGFVKAFNFTEIKELSLSISRPRGIIWLIAFFLFTISLYLLVMNNDYWWILALFSLILSQVLIILFWQDAKFGTIPNVVILLASIIGFAEFTFNQTVSREIKEVLSQNISLENPKITKEMISHLPLPVQNWMNHSGVIGKEQINFVRLKQRALMRMKPEDDNWTVAYAEQYFTVDKPAFIWKVNLQMLSFLEITGRDKFLNGRGSMLIKILSLFPVVDSANMEKLNIGTIQRYLGEIAWFPSAALSSYISWKTVDSVTAEAELTFSETTGSGTFHFDTEGKLLKFTAQRYMDLTDDALPEEWEITVLENRIINGIKIPVKCEVTWKLKQGDWKWLKVEVVDIEYNNANEYTKQEIGIN